MGILELIMLGSALAGLAGKGVSAYKRGKHEKEMAKATGKQEEKTKKLQLRGAMARALGVDEAPYLDPTVKRPKSPSTAWSDILGGLGDVGMQGASMYQAGRMYPMPKPDAGTAVKRIPKRTEQGYML